MFRVDGSYIAAQLEAAGIRSPDGARWDANETALFARQLEYIAAEVYRTEYPDLKARSLFPVNTQVDSTADKYTWRQYDIAGKARIIHNFAQDFPTVEIQGAELSHSIHSLGDAYWYSVMDVRKAAKTGFQIDSEKAAAAREVMEHSLEAIAAVGDAANGIPTGFVNAPNILSVPVTTGASGNTWLQKTPAEIAADVNALQRAIFDTSKGRYQPDTLLLGTQNYSLVATNARAPGFTSDSILQFILSQSPWLKSIEYWPRLDAAGAGGNERIMAYRRDPKVVQLLIPQEFEQFPPQVKNMAYWVNCHLRTAGVVVRRPKAIAFMDGTR